MKIRIGLYSLIVACSLLTGKFSYTQDFEAFTDIKTNPAILKSNGIKSLIVYSSDSEIDNDDQLLETGRVRTEMTFNEDGLTTFIGTTSGSNYLYGFARSYVRWQWFNYDSLQRIRTNRDKNKWSDMTHEFTYNKNGNLWIDKVGASDVDYYVDTLNWVSNKCVSSISHVLDSRFPPQHNIYASDGSYVAHESGNHTTTFKEKQVDEYLQITSTSRHNSIVIHTKTIYVNKQIDRPVYLLFVDSKNDTLKEIRAQYDSKGNLTNFHLKDFSNRKNSTEYTIPPVGTSRESSAPLLKNPLPPPIETILEVENTYDELGLLVKRSYLKVNCEDRSDKKRIETNLFLYKTDELIIPSPPVNEEDSFTDEDDF